MMQWMRRIQSPFRGVASSSWTYCVRSAAISSSSSSSSSLIHHQQYTSITSVSNSSTSSSLQPTSSLARSGVITSSSFFPFQVSHRSFRMVSECMNTSSSSPDATGTNANTPLPLLRNIAIIAHVDHGKTTLVDCLLRSAVASRMDSSSSRVMDSNALEKERGITILSKCTSIDWRNPSDNKTYHINIVDTPGHADFGGEVERVLSMVDGVCLVVDATDGPMTQTKFVLGKALKLGLRPLVVINKVDRPTARVGEVENEIFDLFVNLQATDEQMDFPIVYACARDGWSTMEPKKQGTDMNPLFTSVVSHVKPPPVDRTKPFSMAVTQIESDQFLGKLLLGRIASGTVKVGDKLHALDGTNKKLEEVKVMKIIARKGLEQVPVPIAAAGDIVSLAGFSIATVNSTLCDTSITQALPFTPVDPPTLAMSFSVNTSPFAGQEGSQLTSTMIKDRLLKEAESNVSLQIEESVNKESFEVRGRGELQLGILIETMRREGYELSVSAPRVVLKHDEETKAVLEPLEEVVIDVSQEHTGQVIEKMSSRKGELQDFIQTDDGKARLKFRIPMRGLIGYRSELQNDTRGTGIMNNIFHSYVPFMGELTKPEKGAIVSTAEGVITSFALEGLEARGVLFVEAGMKCYSGMIIGESSREGDLEVNPAKTKQLSNVRSVTKEERVKLTPPRIMSLEEVIAYVREDEIIEVTGKSIRLRKIELDASKRKTQEKHRISRKKAEAGR